MRSDEYIVSHSGMPLSLMLAGSAQCHSMIHYAVFANYRGLTDYYGHSMITEESALNLSSWMHLHPGHNSGNLGEEPGHEKQVHPVQRMTEESVKKHGMEAGIQQEL